MITEVRNDRNGKAVTVGCRVTFIGRRRQVTGIVTGLRIKTIRRGGKKAQLLAALGASGDALDRWVAQVASDNGEGVWTVGLSGLTVVDGPDAGGLVQAAKAVMETKARRQQQLAARRERRVEAARDNGLGNVRHGDPIRVEYRGGVSYTRTFLGYTASGNVRYLQDGRSRSTPPQFVTPAK